MTDDDILKKKNDVRLAVRAVLSPLAIIAIIFLAAGRITYWQGWLYCLLNILILLITLVVLHKKTDLIEERLKPGEGMKSWDKVYFAISTPMFFIAVIAAALDAGRYGWSPELPQFIYAISVAVYIAGHALFLWAKWANRFFSTVVRIQTDRNQEVCESGPYQFIRHPGYFGGVLFELTTPLILGSLWAVIPAVISAISLIIRTYLEDITLQKELPGYDEYARKVRFRLLPGVW